MSSTIMPGGEGVTMSDRTKLGIFLLFPPTVLWGMIILFMLDTTLGDYVFAKMTLTIMDMVFLIAGFVFPGAALAVGINCLNRKLDRNFNLAIVAVSAIMLVLMAVNVFQF